MQLAAQGKVWWEYERTKGPYQARTHSHGQSWSNVRLDLGRFGAFFSLVLRAVDGDQEAESQIAAEYEEALRAWPDPKRWYGGMRP